ncbi:MAG: apolipoprotein N-acyltransferase [Candidatus Cloacimonadota bacterium]|nr:apolipoprotein N-acyltransferase [Candidatus Cloacimonadota bacterium]
MNKIKHLNYYRLVILSSILISISRLDIKSGILSFLGFVPLFYFFDQKPNKKQIIIAASIWASIYNLIVLHFISLVTLPGYILMFGLFSFYFSILFLLINFGWKMLDKSRYFVFVIFWIGFELLQNYGEFRFPWFNLGYSIVQFDTLIQVAEIGGVYLVSLLIILMNISLYILIKHLLLIRRINNYLVKKINKLYLLFPLLIISLWFTYGNFLRENIKIENTAKKATIIQGNISQEIKWEHSSKDSILHSYFSLSKKASAGTDLIIWPESAIPGYFLRKYSLKNKIVRYFKKLEKPLFSGFPHYKPNKEDVSPNKYLFYNSASLINDDGKIDTIYKKNILVPFGERIPFLKYFPFLWDIHLGQANWEYGTEIQKYRLDDVQFTPLICFEIAFPQFTAKLADQDINFMINLTNDAWFKKTTGTYQHAMMTKMRAIETRTQIFRAANTGISMIVMPDGKIFNRTNLFETTSISAPIVKKNKKTFFVKYNKYIRNLIIYISLSLIFILFIKRLLPKMNWRRKF